MIVSIDVQSVVITKPSGLPLNLLVLSYPQSMREFILAEKRGNSAGLKFFRGKSAKMELFEIATLKLQPKK